MLGRIVGTGRVLQLIFDRVGLPQTVQAFFGEALAPQIVPSI